MSLLWFLRPDVLFVEPLWSLHLSQLSSCCNTAKRLISKLKRQMVAKAKRNSVKMNSRVSLIKNSVFKPVAVYTISFKTKVSAAVSVLWVFMIRLIRLQVKLNCLRQTSWAYYLKLTLCHNTEDPWWKLCLIICHLLYRAACSWGDIHICQV